MKAQREAFKIGAVRMAIGRYDTKLAENFDLLYQRSVDFGAHPNAHGAMSAMILDERDGETGLTTVALSDDPKIIAHALKSVAQVGLTVLCLLQHVFKEKFELLGIREEIDALKNTGML